MFRGFEERAKALAKAIETSASAPVVVFSKSDCTFCVRVKQLLTQLGASYKAIELDVESYEGCEGFKLETAVWELTGFGQRTTVPYVFINGKCIGGCDDTVALNNAGKLVPLLTEAGAIAGSASKTTTTA